jgi:hypothetical protein
LNLDTPRAVAAEPNEGGLAGLDEAVTAAKATVEVLVGQYDADNKALRAKSHQGPEFSALSTMPGDCAGRSKVRARRKVGTGTKVGIGTKVGTGAKDGTGTKDGTGAKVGTGSRVGTVSKGGGPKGDGVDGGGGGGGGGGVGVGGGGGQPPAILAHTAASEFHWSGT